MRTHGSGEKHKNTEKRDGENSRERKIEQLRQSALSWPRPMLYTH